jgi:hypothetical protein
MVMSCLMIRPNLKGMGTANFDAVNDCPPTEGPRRQGEPRGEYLALYARNADGGIYWSSRLKASAAY